MTEKAKCAGSEVGRVEDALKGFEVEKQQTDCYRRK
jgi:hypothetical protein